MNFTREPPMSIARIVVAMHACPFFFAMNSRPALSDDAQCSRYSAE
jgi:hypothetical protein